MQPTIPLADVTMYGALDPDGEVYHKCRIGILGRPANAVLYNRLQGEHRWRQVDKLSAANVIEHPDGTLTIEGVSSELVNVVGMRPDEAHVRWEVKPLRCSTCH